MEKKMRNILIRMYVQSVVVLFVGMWIILYIVKTSHIPVLTLIFLCLVAVLPVRWGKKDDN
jgi:hypothetical protein